MKSLEFSLVSSCALDCSFCPQHALKNAYRGPSLMSMETFNKVLDNAGDDVAVYSFAGLAEPYLHPQCSEMIATAARRGVEITLYTTAVGMTPQDVAALKKAGVAWITVHLPDGDGHMKFHPREAYVETLRALFHSGMDVRPMSMGSVHPALHSVISAVPKVSMQNRAGNVLHMPVIANSGPLVCGPAPELDHPVVLPSGEVIACCQDYQLRHILGNLAAQTWNEIYAGKTFQEFKAAMLSENKQCLCRGCGYAVKGASDVQSKR